MPANANAAVDAGRQTVRPRDAATLVLIDRTSGEPRVLMGKRRDDQIFMPGKYVFPGGRVDKEDRHVPCSEDLHPDQSRLLLLEMKGGPSPARARAVALAAIRETFEEAGLVVGRRIEARVSAPAAWQPFFDLGFEPRPRALRLFARAITPPNKTRRYDTRFFFTEAEAIAHRIETNDGELSGLHWLPIPEARKLDLPTITRTMLDELMERLERPDPLDARAPVPFYYQKGGSFRRQMIRLDEAGAASIA